MFELIFVFAMLVWLVFSALEYLSSLAVFPALAVSILALVPLAGWSYRRLRRHYQLEGLDQKRAPVPPERFFWSLRRARLRRHFLLLTPLVGAGWVLLLRFPARWSVRPESLLGWVGALLAVGASAEWLARGYLGTRASRWFDGVAARFTRWTRRLLYRISDDPEFYDEENAAQAALRDRERSIY